MDAQRLMAALLHSSLTVQQALDHPLATPDDRWQKCKRLDCHHWFEKKGHRLYCTDPECRYLVNLDRFRRGNARKKLRGAA